MTSPDKDTRRKIQDLESELRTARRINTNLSNNLDDLVGALLKIRSQENTTLFHEDGPSLVLDCEQKMREIAEEALKPFLSPDMLRRPRS